MRQLLIKRKRSSRGADRLPAAVQAKRDRALEQALATDSIAVVYQPQIHVHSGEIVSVEALARWEGAASAEELFRRAASARLSERLSRSIQRKALQSAGRWRGTLGALRLSINLLAEDLARPGYEQWLLGEIASAGLSPDRVTVEITEGSLVEDRAAAAARLASLRAAGVRIAVDDFGTGYASLAYLTSLPLDTLKIDRGLIADLIGGSRDRIVVKALVALARELELEVIVEGVEDYGQLALLASWNCDLYQGFLGSAALDEEALEAFVEERIRARPAAA